MSNLYSLIARLFLGFLAAAACGAVLAQAAANYPNKPARLIVPFPPGGGNDIVARTVGRKLTDSFAQQVVIDNRGGASGNIGAEIGRAHV